MTNSKELFNELVSRVKLDESKDEIQSIIYLLLEEKLGLSKMDIMTGKLMKSATSAELSKSILRINRHEPIQYIVGKAEFYNRWFTVDRSVLIPRPETELLIRSVLNEKVVAPAILDIGTGSGCVAITLALEIQQSNVYAVDISEKALAIATENAKSLHANVNFSKNDILTDGEFDQQFDLIVSNPPYVTEQEKSSIKANVLDFEPHLALFVTDDDPLIFYRAIATKGKFLLKPGGKVVVEINERFGKELMQYFKSIGYSNVVVEKDIDGKDRILIAEHL